MQKNSNNIFKKVNGWRIFLRVFLIFLVYFFLAIVLLNPGYLYLGLILWPFMGFILAGFLNAAHDCIHNTQLRSRDANRIAATMWCTIIFVNQTMYKLQHLAHHRYTCVDGDTESHPNLTLWSYFFALTGISFWRGVFMTVMRVWKGSFPKSVNTNHDKIKAKWDNIILLIWLIIVSILTIFFPRPLLFGYWIPLIFYPPAIILLSLPEHYGLHGIANVSGNTRSVRSNAILRFFQWNGNYHAEHHFNPGIPALKLNDFYIQRISSQPLLIEERSYLKFHLTLVGKLFKEV